MVKSGGTEVLTEQRKKSHNMLGALCQLLISFQIQKGTPY